MNHSYIKKLVLYCLHKIDGQRTIYSILHLLNGKKSSQTIQDAHLFQLTSLFSTFPTITRYELEKLVVTIENEDLIQQISEQKYRLTAPGIKRVEDFSANHPLPKELNGWKFHHVTEVFWERLTLLVQVTSQLRNHESKFIPIQRKKEVHQWLKGYFHHTQLNRDEMGVRLYQELVECLETYKEANPSILVMRLTGFRMIGQTSTQSAEILGIDPYEYHILFLGIIHYMLDILKRRPRKFPLLGQLIADQITNVSLTQSTKTTYLLLKKGLTMAEIVEKRRLKKSTIEDHVVEIALNIEGFDISPFVSRHKHDLIMNAAQKMTFKQLKHIRQNVPEADYFEIRLVLAQAGDNL